MARLDVLPSPDNIKKMRGIIDYAVWRGVPYARKWPIYHAYKTSAPMKEQIAAYSTWLRTVALTSPVIVNSARLATKGSNWTWRDFLCFAVSGNVYGPE